MTDAACHRYVCFNLPVTDSNPVIPAGLEAPQQRSEGNCAARPGVPPWVLRRLLVVTASTLGSIALFACYLRLAGAFPVNSDGASQALEAWDMLHGNLLLRGWQLTDVSFYTTELPEYMLVELARGLTADVVHVAAAITYTLVVVLAALLAKGRATGRAAVARVLVTAGIMIAPQLASTQVVVTSGVGILVSSPDHIGTAVPLLVVWLVLDRARLRWYVPMLTALLLGWVAMADSLVIYIGILPLMVVCVVRAVRAVALGGQPLESQRYELALIVAAMLAVAAAGVVLHIIRASGGFALAPTSAQFLTGLEPLRNSLGLTIEGLLLLGGADFAGRQLSAGTMVLLLHLVGVILAGWATAFAARRFLRSSDLVDQVLVVAIVVNLAAYVLSTEANSMLATRDIAAVLPFSAVLAGRLLAEQVVAARLAPALLVVLCGYLAGLATSLTEPAAPPQNVQLISWLSAHHLRSGLAGPWQSNVVTLVTGDQIKVRPLSFPGVGRGHMIGSASGPPVELISGDWEADSAWYDSSRQSANFVVLASDRHGYPGLTDKPAVLATFGAPQGDYRFGQFEVLTWNKNLLSDLG